MLRSPAWPYHIGRANRRKAREIVSNSLPTRVLFVAGLSPGDNSSEHIRVLRALGCAVEAINTTPYMTRGGRAATWLRFRALGGPSVSALNRDILEKAKDFQPHLLWAEKPIAVYGKTLDHLRGQGVVLSCLTYDNPFDGMGKPFWRLFRKTIPAFDLHVVPRKVSVADFTAAGARQVMRINFAYDSRHQFPPPARWGDRDRSIDVSFTGTPHDDRAARLLTLWRRHGIAVDIRGDLWQTIPESTELAPLIKGLGVRGDAYRERFWNSRICLAFVTHGNHDDTAHRCFEITGSQGFLLSERTEALREYFVEGEEAVFFSDMSECAEKIRRYLPDEAERNRIARNGHARAVASGYSMTDQFSQVLAVLCARHASIPLPPGLAPQTAARKTSSNRPVT